MNAPNAKTAAAVGMQAPVVASNLLSDRGTNIDEAIYNGYGSCPLTVEEEKIVLAEFGYGGKVLNSFPSWLIDGTETLSVSLVSEGKNSAAVVLESNVKRQRVANKTRKKPSPNSK
ncbi:hypothetical protein P4S73_30280 [Paraglaciecola sp. Hal342]